MHTSAQGKSAWMKFILAAKEIKSFATSTILTTRFTCSLIFTDISHTLTLHCLSFMIVSFSSTSADICFSRFEESLYLRLNADSISGLNINIFSKASTSFFFSLRKFSYARFQRLWQGSAFDCEAWLWTLTRISLRWRLTNHILPDGFQAQLQPHLPGSISTVRRSTRLLGWVSIFPLFASMMGDAFLGDTQIDDRCCSLQKVLWDA